MIKFITKENEMISSKLTKIGSIAMIMAMIFALLAACAKAPTQEAPTQEAPAQVAPAASEAPAATEAVQKPAARPYEGQKVTVLLEDTPWHHGIEKTAPAWAEAMGVELELEFLPEVQSREKVDLDLTTGTGLYDVFLTDEMYIAKEAQLGALEPLEPYIEKSGFDTSDFPPLGLQSLTFDGHLYGIPWRSGMNMLFYRKDITDKYNIPIPTTYDELMKAAIDVQDKLRADGIQDVYGFVGRGLRGEGLNIWIVGNSIIPAWGAKWFDESGKPTVNSPEFVAAVDYYATLLQKAGPPNAPAMSWDDTVKLFDAGKAVFWIDSGILLAQIKDAGSEVAKNSEATVIPTGPAGTHHTGLYSPSYVMSKMAKNKEAAWEFIKFATTYEQMSSDSIDGDNFEIARSSVVASKEFQARFPYPSLIDTQLKSFEWAREERPMIVKWPQVGDIVGAAVQSVIAGEKTAQDALDEAQKEIEVIFQ